MPAFALLLRGRPALAPAIGEERLERAVGVIYRPDLERERRYFETRLGQRFDAILFIERTRPVRPL